MNIGTYSIHTQLWNLHCIEYRIQSFANNLIKWAYKNDVDAIFNAENNIYNDMEVAYTLLKCIVYE